MTFLSEGWNKLSLLRSVLFTVSALEVLERETYRKQTGSNVYLLLNKVSSSNIIGDITAAFFFFHEKISHAQKGQKAQKAQKHT